MKKITKEQFEQFNSAASPDNQLAKDLADLEVDNGMIITKEEYTMQSRINVVVSYYAKKLGRKFKVRQTKDPAGWVILRIN